MAFKRKRIRYIDIEAMVDIVDYCRENKICVARSYDREKKRDNLECYAYIENKLVELKITTKYKGKNVTFVSFKDGRDYLPGASPLDAYMTLNQYWKVPVVKNADELRFEYSASPLLGFNPKYENQKLKGCWCYDLNNAYAKACLSGWIDASKPPRNKKIEPWHEVGFDFDDDGKMYIKESGYSTMVFERIDTPDGIKKWINYYCDLRLEAKIKERNATTEEELKEAKEQKKKCKDMINFAIGYLQRKNPWLRAWVVCSCNKFIANLLDEDSLFWNTDSITSKRRRFDLEENLGDNVGQWKVEHYGTVAYRGNCYQWNGEIPTYRGTPKSWFPEGWDILKDPRPVDRNLFVFDFDSMTLKEVNYEIG